jgi:hypothetical protein
VFFVSADSKGLNIPVNPLDATLIGAFVSVASKRLECGQLRPKTGKTRCLPVSVDCKGLRWLWEQGKEVKREKELNDRQGCIVANTKKNSMEVPAMSITLLAVI